MKTTKPLKLSLKQERFCHEYFVDMNATQAAIRAGHGPKSAARAGWRYLNSEAVQQYLEEQRRITRKRMRITEEDILVELARVGFSNIRKFLGNDNLSRDLESFDPAELACVASVKVTAKDSTRSITEIKLHNKLAALKDLSRHLGLFQQRSSNKPAENNHVSIMRLGDGTEVEI